MAKPRPRHYIYFILCFIISFKLLWPVCSVDKTKIIYLFAGFVVTLVVLELYICIRRSHIIRSYLDAGDVEKFLAETDDEIKHTASKPWRLCYQVNKSAGLYYLGRFEEAIALLDTINIKKLPKLFKYLYINNRLANVLGLQRLDEAKKLIEENNEAFKPCKYNRQIYPAMQSNLGAYKYYNGELEAARNLLKEGLSSLMYPLSQAVVYYYLGRVSQDEGKAAEADEYFQKAKELGKDIYIAKWIGSAE